MPRSEYELKRHLSNPRIASIGNTPEVAVRDRRVGVVQQRVIEKVEKLGSILNLKSFSERKCPVRREVNIEGPRPDQNIAAGIPETV